MTASLAVFGSIAAVAGGVAIAAGQGGKLTAQHEKMTDDAYIDIAAAVSTAGTAAFFIANMGPSEGPLAIAYVMAAQCAVNALAVFNGFGKPDDGGDFRKGHDEFFNEIYETLEEALPTNWTSEGAKDYEDWVEEQKSIVDIMASADLGTSRDLHQQSCHVEDGRLGFASLELAVTGILVTTLALAAALESAWATSWIPGAAAVAEGLGEAMAAYVEGAVFAVLAGALGLMTDLLSLSGQTFRGYFHDKENLSYSPARSRARNIASSTKIIPDPVVPEDGGTVDPVFPDLPDTPDTPASDDTTADTGDDTHSGRIPIGFFTRDPIFTGDRIAEASTQAAAVHTQMSALSKEAAPYMNMANQVEQQAQQISSSVQQMASQANQGQEAAKDATLADDTAEDPEAKDKDGTDEATDGATPDDKMTLAGAAPDEAAGPAGAPPADRVTLAGATSDDQDTSGAALAQAVLAASMNSAAAATGVGAAPAGGVPFGVATPAGNEHSDEMALAQRMGFN